MKREVAPAMLFSAFGSIVFGQKAVVKSPNQKIVENGSIKLIRETPIGSFATFPTLS